ncbi:MAG: SulP family inorganic anion transporter [Candidatus Bathyarchaeia archaeon]
MNKPKVEKKSATSDGIAGLTVALVNIPEGMAYSIVAKINPLYGLYAGIVPPIMAGLFSSSAFMVVTFTNEMALMTMTLMGEMGEEVSVGVLFMFTIMIGLWQILFGVLKLGTFMRFVSQSVMTGFVTGLALLVILGQVGEITGSHSEYQNKVLAVVDILARPGSWDIPTLVAGIIMIVLIVALLKTPLRKIALISALVITSVLVYVANWNTVHLVGEIADINASLPLPTLPEIASIPDLIVPSLATAILGIAVSAGVAQYYLNPDGNRADPNRDFIGLGAANAVGGIFQSAPSCGSLSRTAVVVSAGAKTRMANIFSGIIMAVAIMTIIPLANMIPMPALAGLLVYVGFETINEQRILRGWKTHLIGRIAMIFTFVMTLTVNIINAFMWGILISLALYIYQSSLNAHVKELIPLEGGHFKEQEPPKEFPSNQVTVLSVYGSQYFASVETMRKKFPSAENLKNAAVIFVDREMTEISNTLITWIQDYSKRMQASGNRLIMAEINPKVKAQLVEAKALKIIGEENVFVSEPKIGASIVDAIAEANDWLKKR